MKIYFEDGALMHSSLVPVQVDYRVDAGKGVTACVDLLDMLVRQRPNATVYTNSIFAFNNMYAWNENIDIPEIYIRSGKNKVFTRIDKLTTRELRRGHNLAHMYVAGEFSQSIH